MREHDLERMAWERLDGSIAAEDESRLEALLATDPAALQRCAEVEQLAANLGAIRPATPPAELRARIDRAIASASPPWRRRRITSGLWPLRLAYMAAGVLLGLVAARLLMPSSLVDQHVVAGAMTTPASAVRLDLGEGGSLSLWRTDTSLTAVDVDLADDAEIAVVVDAVEGMLSIARTGFSGVAEGEAVNEDGRVRIDSAGSGHAKVVVRSEIPSSALVIRVTARGRLVAERVVQPEELDGDL
jgi:hypothetical protein